MRDLLENPAYHEYVMRAVIAKEGRLFNEYWGRLKIAWMSCTACGRREKTLAAADLDEYAPSGDELWWTTQNPEILLLQRWQVPVPRMVLFDEEHGYQPSSQP
ncbi:hypothetical protein [Deinococcus marmoris]|uniref:Uncharacterized protein n=1 Tax=Deinococcus marmoris TaxID=249408 RepID=A0A1U7NVH5_9DEIO|nr:hypothetical protein [Deinococcus marmoris]OLV16914.1 hypothetical protein BOO71_0010414 [Deinococcus marmoris]